MIVGYDSDGQPIERSTLLECAMEATDPDASRCICRGTGRVVSDDDRRGTCPYHWEGNRVCPDCGFRMTVMPYMMKGGKFRGDDCPNEEHDAVFQRLVSDDGT